MGVQFTPPRGYKQIFGKDVWELFSGEYPNVEEQPPMQPAFEMFGLNASNVPISFNLVPMPLQTRYWFVSEDGHRITQFQSDRLMHNWRDLSRPEARYPRFESMVGEFEKHILLLKDYFSSNLNEEIAITQCELMYLNAISEESSELIKFSKWIKVLTDSSFEPENLAANLQRVVKDTEGRPVGRLYLEMQLGFSLEGRSTILFNLTMRGAPAKPDVGSALEFLHFARDIIVQTFADVTTDSAHNAWEMEK